MKYYTKEIFKLTNIMAIAFLIITAILLMKYKPVYKVSVSGLEMGYVKNKQEFENQVDGILDKGDNTNIAFVTMDTMPNYEFALVDAKEQTDEQKIIATLKEEAKTTYTMYAVTLNGEEKTYVSNIDEAEKVVETIKEETKKEELEVGIRQIYTEENKEIQPIEVAVQELKEEGATVDKKEEAEKKAEGITVINGITIANKPVTGTVTSRFGVSSRIRSSNHTGLDIAAKSGTPIKACSEGTVVFSGRNGSYGNLVRISHGNGLETWYAHCSKLYVSKGQKIEAGETIAAVGSTGNSTGPHLHLEIRVNDKPLNPQKYLY